MKTRRYRRFAFAQTVQSPLAIMFKAFKYFQVLMCSVFRGPKVASRGHDRCNPADPLVCFQKHGLRPNGLLVMMFLLYTVVAFLLVLNAASASRHFCGTSINGCATRMFTILVSREVKNL